MINLDIEKLAAIQEKRRGAYMAGYAAFENNPGLAFTKGCSLFLLLDESRTDAIAQVLWLQGWTDAKGEFNL
jgi:hypothetical protein